MISNCPSCGCRNSLGLVSQRMGRRDCSAKQGVFRIWLPDSQKAQEDQGERNKFQLESHCFWKHCEDSAYMEFACSTFQGRSVRAVFFLALLAGSLGPQQATQQELCRLSWFCSKSIPGDLLTNCSDLLFHRIFICCSLNLVKHI